MGKDNCMEGGCSFTERENTHKSDLTIWHKGMKAIKKPGHSHSHKYSQCECHAPHCNQQVCYDWKLRDQKCEDRGEGGICKTRYGHRAYCTPKKQNDPHKMLLVE